MRVAFIGNLAGVAYAWAKLLRRKGLAVELYLAPGEWGPDWEDGGLPQAEPGNLIHYYDHSAPSFRYLPTRLQYRARRFYGAAKKGKLLRTLLDFDIVTSFTGSLFFSQGAVNAFGIQRRKPYVACATGSDITEVAVQDGRSGQQMRQFFQHAVKSLLLNVDMIDLKDRLNLKNAEFFPYLIDIDKYSPGSVSKEYGSRDQTLFFMFSRLDWGVLDNAPGRKSTKGNDRFIRAFARYVKEHNDAHLLMLDRGADRVLARQLVSELGLSPYVSYLAEMRKNELVNYFRMADVIVDQFDIGSPGVGALEAMACAKPVMIHLKDDCVAACYPEYPPVLKARTEDEIYAQIKLAVNPIYREEIARKAREWILRYHDWNIVGDRLICLYEDVLRNWNHNQMEKVDQSVPRG